MTGDDWANIVLKTDCDGEYPLAVWMIIPFMLISGKLIVIDRRFRRLHHNIYGTYRCGNMINFRS